MKSRCSGLYGLGDALSEGDRASRRQNRKHDIGFTHQGLVACYIIHAGLICPRLCIGATPFQIGDDPKSLADQMGADCVAHIAWSHDGDGVNGHVLASL